MSTTNSVTTTESAGPFSLSLDFTDIIDDLSNTWNATNSPISEFIPSTPLMFATLACVPPNHKSTTIVLCFDGTGASKVDVCQTNVARIFDCLVKSDEPGTQQKVYYQVGVPLVLLISAY